LPGWTGALTEASMTEFVGSNLNFGDLILKEEFDYLGKIWRSYLLIPQEHLEDLFRTHQSIRPIDAYQREQQFWDRISTLTRDFYKDYLQTQMMLPNSATRRQWFQWKDFSRLESAYRAFKANTNQPIRLSIFARDPAV
jgi:hypothetical protein